jgi:tetratricopeptide (TPR) repeat protein
VANTGVHKKFREYITLESGNLITLGDELWLPIECTALNLGFEEAWNAGARIIAANKRDLEILDLSEALSQYHESMGAAIPPSELRLPNSEAVYLAYFDNLSAFETTRRQERESAIVRIQSSEPKSLPGVNDLAYWLTLEDDLTEAESLLLSEVERLGSEHSLLNNLGNCALLHGDAEMAMEYYYQSIEADSSDVSPLINLALVFESIGDDSAAVAVYEHVLNYISADELCDKLGIGGMAPEFQRNSEKTRMKTPPKEVVQYHVESALQNRALSPSKKSIRRVPDPDHRERQKRRIRSAGRRGLPGAEHLSLFDYLVWSRGQVGMSEEADDGVIGRR